jgi:hypothetical protein
MTRLYARSNDEAHLYMDHQPCTCGETDFDRRSTVVKIDGVLCSRYAGACARCGTRREFTFELPEVIRPVGEQLAYGGDDPSRLFDPGEWLAIADDHAKRAPATPRDLAIARAAIEEVLKFIPPGGERVPDAAFHTARGQAVRDAEPGRFRRPRLEAVRATYAKLVETAAIALDQLPVADLIDATARAVARQEGFAGTDLDRHATALASQLRVLARAYQIKAREEQQRRQSTVEIEQLIDRIARTGTPLGAAIAAHRADIIDAFRQVDVGKIGGGVQVLMQWMRDPTAATRAPVEQLLADLQATLGPPTGGSERDAEARRIERAVQAALHMLVPATR